MRQYRRRIKWKVLHKHVITIFLLAVLFIILIWAIIFKFTEWRNFLDSTYFIVMTITTIGYGDITPITQPWKIISMIYAFMWVPIFFGIMGILLENRIKKTMEIHMMDLKKELIDTEEKLEETERKLLKEEKVLVKIKRAEQEEANAQRGFRKRFKKKNK